MKEKQYEERDAFKLDIAGGYYCRHVSAMTSEKLHSKSDIAAELGHRDMIIDELLEALQDMLSGWKYIRDQHGDLYGVGWDRSQNKAVSAINKATGETK